MVRAFSQGGDFDIRRMPLASRISLLFLLAVSLTMPSMPGRAAPGESARFVRIATGPVGGTYFPVGGAFAKMISEPPGAAPCGQGGTCGVPGLVAAAVSTQGSPDNIRQLFSGAVQMALCQADIARDAYAGQGLFAGQPVPVLRSVANLFPEAVHVVVRAGEIRAIRELRGKRVSVGEAKSGTLAMARLVLQAYGLGIRDIDAVYERLARSADMLVAGQIDAFFIVGGAPVSAVALAAETVPIALLPIGGPQAQRILAAQRSLLPSTIDDGTYSNVPATPTVAVRAQLLVAATMPEELVFAITRALWDPRNRKVLDAIPIGHRIQRQAALDNLSVPLHPGARRFYSQGPAAAPGGQ
jgi:TRAP transporter TAXI family solute receptor